MVRRIIIVFFTTVLLVIIAAIGMLYAAFRGPSESIRDKLTLSLLETSAAYFVPKLFLGQEQVDLIVADNAVEKTTETTNVSLVTIVKPKEGEKDPSGTDISAGDNDPEDPYDEWAGYEDGTRLEYISGDTYKGYVLLIRDPSRVYLGTSSDYMSGKAGVTLTNAYKREGAVAAINASGFPDINGQGDGGLPIGMVFSKGSQMYGDEGVTYEAVIGFNNDGVLIVGNMTLQKARDMGIRDACCFGPILVVNGKAAQSWSPNGSLNPRTAIGQRADGTVIFLVVDGRQPSSMGASYYDLTEIMLRYGAVNAANLDGGSSSQLIYKGETINQSSSVVGQRPLPTFFMVKPS